MIFALHPETRQERLSLSCLEQYLLVHQGNSDGNNPKTIKRPWKRLLLLLSRFSRVRLCVTP